MTPFRSQTSATARLVRACAGLAMLAPLATLSGCDYLGLQPVSQIEARREAEGKAIGGACRQAGRALEDCFTFNPQVPKASVFAGWRDMNDYMTQNHLNVVRPEVAPVMPTGRARMNSPAADSSVDLPKAAARAALATP